MENGNVTEVLTKENEQLLKDVKNVLLSVSVGAAGYFLIELGKGIINAVVKNGLNVPELPKK
ncbi:MAG: hypothetical protein K0R00_199 [Herbinix sp.]|nr:hypothetical protein [Herbinix sp.]